MLILSLKHGLLGLLNYYPMTGYQLDKKFKETLGHFWQAKASQIYRELDVMEQSGWLTSERVIQDERPNKRVYSITAEGKNEFMDWLQSPEAYIKNAANTKSAFLMRVFFAGETSEKEALDLLHSFRDICIEFGMVMDNIKKDIARYELAHDPEEGIYRKFTALYGEMMSRTMLEWVEKCIVMLEDKA
ncbi:MAG: PadR family transcriptional regulator [Defluviitaleaceae bacterium]|nr:PadR family transcriptional regulator [Defluviitaleaceae bacterium]